MQTKKNNIIRTGCLIMLAMAIIFFAMPLYAQQSNDTTTSVYSAPEAVYNKMLDFSRPGKYHQLLADITGKWIFKGKHFEWVDSVTTKIALEYSGTVVREPFANGRYFVVNVTSDGTLEMPVQDGKMQETKFHGIDIEGYDNVKKKFIKCSIGNHLLSSLVVSEGVYDPATKTITFDSEFEAVPGMKTKDHFLFIFIDKDHYKWEVYQEDKGKFRKGSEIDFVRTK